MYRNTPDSREPQNSQKIMLDRYRGCLQGGAVGDALGYPVEFQGEKAIFEAYGDKGIRTLSQAGKPALISDDTQMTLFAANALLYARDSGMPLTESLWLAYQEWLGTQGDTSRMKNPASPRMWIYHERRLHALRAPGNTCLRAISTSPAGGTMQQPVNNSKGCGTVMRAAPFGLAVSPRSARGDGLIAVHKMAACDAALTHGHPLAWASSSLLAQMIYYIVHQEPTRDDALQQVIPYISVPGDQVAHEKLEQAVRLALDPSVPDLDGIHALGEGWVAEEALAIAVFCAVRYQDDFAAAIRAAVNHKGDSDSTGAICGNILGAWLGGEAVAAAFDLDDLELRDLIDKVAVRLFESVSQPAMDDTGDSDHRPQAQPACETEKLPPLRPVGLMYTPLTKKALAICFDAHEHQKDKSGMPYVIHPLHLAEQMETEHEVCAALLHDVVEDTRYTMEDLRERGIPQPVLEALALLTHDPRTPYLDYVSKLRRNPIARRVKLADLMHNSDLERLDAVGEADRRRILKYRMAQAILADDPFDGALKQFRKRIPLSLTHPVHLSVYYDRDGRVLRYSIDVREENVACYEFDAQSGDRLRIALNPNRSLPEALADVKPGTGLSIENVLMRAGIPYGQRSDAV